MKKLILNKRLFPVYFKITYTFTIYERILFYRRRYGIYIFNYNSYIAYDENHLYSKIIKLNKL